MVKRSMPKALSDVLPPAPPGHGDFWATVHVKFHVPVPDVDDPGGAPAQGYYRTFGVRAMPKRVHDVLVQLIDDGAIDWSDTEWHLADSSKLDPVVQARITSVATEGIWYKSGRVLYADPDLEPRPS